MTRLIHLNGPPGIGKTTLAHLWADRHPGTLVADIDALHQFVGGWQDVAQHPHHVLEPLANAMIRTHLSGGYDVVLPQYLARPDRLASFAGLATETGAQFIEVVLLTDRDQAVARFGQRVDDTEWGHWNPGSCSPWAGRPGSGMRTTACSTGSPTGRTRPA